MSQQNTGVIADQSQALTSYIDALLMTDLVQAPVLPAANDRPDAGGRATAEAVAEARSEEVPRTLPLVNTHTPVPSLRERAGFRNAIERQSMVCLIFNIAGLQLALPLDRVTGVLDFALCSGAHLPPTQLGVIQHAESNIPVFDAAHFILPRTVITHAYQQVVVVDNIFAVACHKAGAVIEVMSDRVRWRSAHTQRRWLAGMLVNQHAALLDADALAQQLIAQQLIITPDAPI